MAIEEHDREDLLRDGKTMLLRGETTIDGKIIVVGFRSEGQMSLYCGADPVFQFNRLRQLRRVYFEGQRYAAENGKLVRLSRESKGGRVHFERSPIASDSDRQIRDSLSDWLARIRASDSSTAVVWRVVSEGEESETLDRFLRNLHVSIESLKNSWQIASDSGV